MRCSFSIFIVGFVFVPYICAAESLVFLIRQKNFQLRYTLCPTPPPPPKNTLIFIDATGEMKNIIIFKFISSMLVPV